mgnify:CR=1 FL=1
MVVSPGDGDAAPLPRCRTIPPGRGTPGKRTSPPLRRGPDASVWVRRRQSALQHTQRRPYLATCAVVPRWRVTRQPGARHVSGTRRLCPRPGAPSHHRSHRHRARCTRKGGQPSVCCPRRTTAYCGGGGVGVPASSTGNGLVSSITGGVAISACRRRQASSSVPISPAQGSISCIGAGGCSVAPAAMLLLRPARRARRPAARPAGAGRGGRPCRRQGCWPGSAFPRAA